MALNILKKFELAVEKPLHKENSWTDGFTVKRNQTVKEKIIPIIDTLFHKIKMDGILL